MTIIYDDNELLNLLSFLSQVGKTRFLHAYIEDRNRESMIGGTVISGTGPKSTSPNNNKIIGNNNCDLNSSFESDKSQDDYSPTTLEIYKARFMVNAAHYTLVITDVTGDQENKSYVELRNSFYKFQPVCLVLFY